ncbi:MAG: Dna2/Cas4 domain-containing protein [Candidatus Pacearchaeota archaeon]
MVIDFNQLIDNFLAREPRQRVIGRYYPSDIGNCLRKVWFSYKTPKQIDPKVKRIFEAGNMVHEFITKVIKDERNKKIELIANELPIEIKTNQFIIAGRVDNIILIRLPELNKKFLVEVKSTKQLPNLHKPEHEDQLQLYMYSLAIDNGIILYIQKDNLDTKAFEVKYNENRLLAILNRFNELHNCLIQNKVPFAEGKQSGREWMCVNCAWRDECDKIGKEGED